jgi:hypothetical protein
MAVLVLQAALIVEPNLTVPPRGGNAATAQPNRSANFAVQPILLDRDDSDRIGFKQHLTPRRKPNRGSGRLVIQNMRAV